MGGQAVQVILRDEGLRGFFRGVVPSYWGITENAVHFVLYERLKKVILERVRPRFRGQTVFDPTRVWSRAPFQRSSILGNRRVRGQAFLNAPPSR